MKTRYTTPSARSSDSGSTKLWILVGLFCVLGAGAIFLVASLHNSSETEEADSEVHKPRRSKRMPPPPPYEEEKPLGKTAADQKDLIDQVKKGGKSELDLLLEDGKVPPIAATVKGPPEGPGDTLDPDVRMAMGVALQKIKKCYQKQLARNPKLLGMLTLSFSIAIKNNEAVVDKPEIRDSGMKDFNLEDCVLKTLTLPRFPMSLVEKGEKVIYPIVFAPGNEAPPPGHHDPLRPPIDPMRPPPFDPMRPPPPPGFSPGGPRPPPPPPPPGGPRPPPPPPPPPGEHPR